MALGLEILIAAFFVEPFITLQNFAVAGKGEWIFNPFFFFEASGNGSSVENFLL